MGLFFEAEDGIRDLVRSRGLGDVYKRQIQPRTDLDERRETRRIELGDLPHRPLLGRPLDSLSLIHI